jgi:hypothetical protein
LCPGDIIKADQGYVFRNTEPCLAQCGFRPDRDIVAGYKSRSKGTIRKQGPHLSVTACWIEIPITDESIIDPDPGGTERILVAENSIGG